MNPDKLKTKVLQLEGITLRDLLAGQALANKYTHSNHPDLIAKYAYYIADAMLEARKVDRYYLEPYKA